MNSKARTREPLICMTTVYGLGALLTCMTSCVCQTKKPTEAPAMITVREVINRDGVKYPTRVYVYRDGKYVLDRVDPTSKSDRPKREEGRLSPGLVAELESLVKAGAASKGSGPAQYDVYPDNSYITPPKAITDLFEAVIK